MLVHWVKVIWAKDGRSGTHNHFYRKKSTSLTLDHKLCSYVKLYAPKEEQAGRLASGGGNAYSGLASCQLCSCLASLSEKRATQ